MRKLLSLFFVLILTGCATNIGRAFSTTFNGTPEEVVSSIQFVNKSMRRELREKYEAIESSTVINPDGSVNLLAAQNRFNDMSFYHGEIERWEELSNALAMYLGVKLDEPADASEHLADKKRKDFWSSLLKGTKGITEELKEKTNVSTGNSIP